MKAKEGWVTQNQGHPKQLRTRDGSLQFLCLGYLQFSMLPGKLDIMRGLEWKGMVFLGKRGE